MRTGLLRIVVFLLASTTFALPAQAEWLCDFFNSVARDVKRRQCWPKPFVCPDIEAANAPFAIQVENGWRRQNTLAGFHFEPGNGQLTEAGRLKVEWIALRAPEQHRTVFVQRARSAQETVARIQAAQQLAAQVSPQGPPPVLETTTEPAGWPADRVDAIGREFRKAIPKPTLPAASPDTAGK